MLVCRPGCTGSDRTTSVADVLHPTEPAEHHAQRVDPGHVGAGNDRGDAAPRDRPLGRIADGVRADRRRHADRSGCIAPPKRPSSRGATSSGGGTALIIAFIARGERAGRARQRPDHRQRSGAVRDRDVGSTVRTEGRFLRRIGWQPVLHDRPDTVHVARQRHGLRLRSRQLRHLLLDRHPGVHSAFTSPRPDGASTRSEETRRRRSTRG